MSCPFAVKVKGISSSRGCNLTVSKTRQFKGAKESNHYMLCPPSCYEDESVYTGCPYYRERDMRS